ncbi:hypothetical protein FOCC_FOCC007346 [Frankliniella occidentalis]|nr:hypothetical protein FOCC_FOCC007346 [Frankliniella occidentalis]
MTGKRASGKRPKKRKGPTTSRHSLAGRVQREAAAREEEQPERPSSSASDRKIEDEDAEVPDETRNWSGLRVLDIDRVFKFISEKLVCKKCQSDVSIEEVSNVGLGSTFELSCINGCKKPQKFDSSERVLESGASRTTTYLVNTRLVYLSQLLGFRFEGIKKIHAFMDFSPPISYTLYRKTLGIVHNAIKRVSEESMLAGVEEEKELAESSDILASGDGSWQKRGFSSKNGIVSLIGQKSGKVLDVQVMSTVCYGCSNYRGPKQGIEYQEWKDAHKPVCSINHDGSAGMMEVKGMMKIFHRSVNRAQYRIRGYIGDGDSKTFSAVVNSKPYGDELVPIKIECTGHVQKRMGKRLRDLKKKMKGLKLKDGKGLGGKGRLTDGRIDQISSYYGNAIRSSETVTSMKRNIWAIFYHIRSRDSKPQHKFCPKGPNSWCKYVNAKRDGSLQNFKHKNSLPVVVMDAIKPVFVDLTKEDLLQRCVGGHTQNSNESFNAVIWKNVPKSVFCGKTTLDVGVADAVLTFNNGQKGRLKVLSALNIIPGTQCVRHVNQCDWLRVKVANRRSLDATKEARQAKRRREKNDAEQLATGEGDPYEAGAY